MATVRTLPVSGASRALPTLQIPPGPHTLRGMTGPEIKVLPDPASVAREAAERFVRLAREAIADHGRFSVALAGGSTPKAMYELLAAEPLRSQVDWARVLAFFGDERCVPPDHKDSNYRMAEQALLTKVPIPGDNVYRMRGEIDPNEAAKEYGLTLKEMFPSTGSGQAATAGSTWCCSAWATTGTRSRSSPARRPSASASTASSPTTPRNRRPARAGGSR